MGGFQTWVINLDRAPQRLARIAAQLELLKMPFHRLSAVDAQAMAPEQRAQLDDAAYRRKHGMSPVLGELGCYLSHLAVMKDFLASDAEFALVLEDDVLLHQQLPAVLQGLQHHAARWDMCKLSAVHSGTPQPGVQLAPDCHLAVMLSRCTGSSAYAVNRHAAQAYLQHLLPMSLPYDHVFDQGWHLRLKVRLAMPTPCRHDEDIASTIVAPPGLQRKFPWRRRLPALRYRVAIELRRVVYGLREWRREKDQAG